MRPAVCLISSPPIPSNLWRSHSLLVILANAQSFAEETILAEKLDGFKVILAYGG